jgi:hypothetical protein
MCRKNILTRAPMGTKFGLHIVKGTVFTMVYLKLARNGQKSPKKNLPTNKLPIQMLRTLTKNTARLQILLHFAERWHHTTDQEPN